MSFFSQRSLVRLSSAAREGDLVVASFPEDGEVYRAKVTAVRQRGLSGHVYEVLYLDYGNTGRDLTQADLFSWDPLYEMIQPQAGS